MTRATGPGRELGEGYKYVALGMTFAGAIIMFMVGGWALDRWLGLTPLFTVTGTLVGAVLSFLSVYRKLQAELEARQRKRDRDQ
jgi:F0F1-type ATP synthase assembly protein I